MVSLCLQRRSPQACNVEAPRQSLRAKTYGNKDTKGENSMKYSVLYPQPNKQRAFSLIEILVVITIIGILITVSGGAYVKYMEEAEMAKTKELLIELETYACDYNEKRGDYPPSTLKYLNITTTGDDANEGIEAFVQALYKKGYNGGRRDDTSFLINTDDDDADKKITIFGNSALFEIADTWGNPIIYIRHSDYKKIFTYVLMGAENEDGGNESVSAWIDPLTKTYYKFESCQFISAGPDGDFNTEDDVCNFERNYEDE